MGLFSTLVCTVLFSTYLCASGLSPDCTLHSLAFFITILSDFRALKTHLRNLAFVRQFDITELGIESSYYMNAMDTSRPTTAMRRN
jgi:hypothetical protein